MHNTGTDSYRLRLTTTSVNPGYNISRSRGQGSAVRCVAKNPTMQEFDPSTLADGETTTLTDARDHTRYTVKKFGSGSNTEVWMTSNLTLGYHQLLNKAKAIALTNADTNIPESDTTTYYLPPAGKRGSVTSSSTMTSTNAATFNTSNVNQAHVQFEWYPNASIENLTGYYNYTAATLGFSYYNDGKASGNTPRDICPKGWQLPSTGYFHWLDITLGGTGSNRNGDTTTINRYMNDFNLISSTGYYRNNSLNSASSANAWWSNTINNSANSYSLYIDSDGTIAPQNGNFEKYAGLAIRCIAK